MPEPYATDLSSLDAPLEDAQKLARINVAVSRYMQLAQKVKQLRKLRAKNEATLAEIARIRERGE